MSEITAERIFTGYKLTLDSATIELLLGQVVSVPAVIAASPVGSVGSGIEYVVLWSKDNPYVHKAMRKKLREMIKAAKDSRPVMLGVLGHDQKTARNHQRPKE